MYNIVTKIIVATFYLFFKQTSKVKQLITLSWFMIPPIIILKKHYNLMKLFFFAMTNNQAMYELLVVLPNF